MVTTATRPAFCSMLINIAADKFLRARRAASLLTPISIAAHSLNRTDRFLFIPAFHQRMIETSSVRPRRAAAFVSHVRGIGPFKKSSPTPWRGRRVLISGVGVRVFGSVSRIFSSENWGLDMITKTAHSLGGFSF